MEQVVLFAPSGKEPIAEELVVVEGNVGDGEAAPVQVYGLWRASLEVGTIEGEEVLAVLAGAVVC